MEDKPKPCTKKTLSTAMATKSKRAKVDASKSSDEVGDNLRAIVTRLQSELEVERKSSKQLRREKAVEVQQVREAEQNRSAASQKELATKLHQEKQKELETQRESLRCKHEAEMIKAIKQKDLEIRKLHRDLQKCQDELKEEIAKRGLSTSARSAFELERAKLLQEIKEQTSAKKQLEDALHAAKEAEKQKNLEIRQLQEHCRLEVAKVEKEAGMEVRKLLEELKSKDHLLAQMDRNQYPDRGNALRQHLANQPVDELLNLSKDLETKETTSNNQKQESAASPTPTGLQSIGWQKKIYELEKQIRLASGLNHAFIEKNKEVTTMNSSLEGKIKNLTEENQELSCELTSAKHEMKKLNELMSGSNLESLTIQLEKLRKQIKDQEYVIAQLRFDCHEKDRQIRQKANKPKKAVRFLLPGETVPLAPGFDIDDVISDGRHSDDNSGDDNADAMSVDSSLSDVTIQSSQQSDLNLADDDQELIEPSILLESVERDYEQLMREHLTLEQSYASLIHSYSLRVEGEPPPDEWKIERESLNLAIYALEEKVRRCEENEELVRIKLEQITEEKEELEFKVLEHEECYGRIGGDGAEIDAEMLEKNQKLQSEVFQLQQKLEKYENGVKVSERDVGLQCNRIADLEEVVDAKVISPRPSGLELSTENLSRLGLSQDDTENDSGSEMVLSTTASSGFDETSSEAEESGFSSDPRQKVEKVKKAPAAKEVMESTASLPLTSTPKKLETAETGDRREECIQEMEVIIENFQTMETTWKTTVDKLERQLQQSFLRERIIRDQMALVEEEKNRRINALQGQIDLLEENEFRLSETIQALENVALGVEALQEHVASKESVASELDRDVEELDARRKQLREEVEKLLEAGKILDQVKIHISNQVATGKSHESEDQTSADGKQLQPGELEVFNLVDAVEKALHNSITRLEFVNQQLGEEIRKEKELGQRIRKLESETWKNDEDDESHDRKCLNASKVRKAVVECNQIVSNFAVEELQADLRELRGLLLRLKAVINFDEMDSKTQSAMENSQLSVLAISGSKEARERLSLNLAADVSKAAEDWLAIASPDVKVLSEFGERDNDATEFQLRQKVDELEKECERLQKLVHEEEQVIRDLHFQNLELKDSEKNFQHLVERLEASEEDMHCKMEEMAEEMESLQMQVKQLETKERLAKAQLLKHQDIEAELEERLEQAMDEMQSNKQKSGKRILELENEKKTLIRKTEEQADRIGDLEGLSGSLKLRIRNLETSESSLRNEMRKMEAELSSAAGQLSELEQQKENLVQRLQDLEKEKSKLLFEIADLTMDSNKQGHKITLLNQEIGKLRGSLVNKDEVIACLQGKLEEASGMLDGLRAKVATLESADNSLSQEAFSLVGIVADRDERNAAKGLNLKEKSQLSTCHQSTQTGVEPVRAKLVIEKATQAFQETILSLGERHPEVLQEFLCNSLFPLLPSYDSDSDKATIPAETMQRFISSLQVEFPHESKVFTQYSNDLSHEFKEGEEDRHWTTVEDPHVIYDVRAAENATYWKDIESKMGLNSDALMLTIEFGDPPKISRTKGISFKTTKDAGLLVHQIPPPLPTSSPPPLSPEPRPDEADESADEASEINDEDDGAVPLSDSVATNWKVPYHGTARLTESSSPSPRRLRPLSSSSNVKFVEPSETRYARASSVDRVCTPVNRNAFRSELHRTVTGSVESITDSGMDSLRLGNIAIPEEMAKSGAKRSFFNKLQLKDQATQACDHEKPFESVIILQTQLEQRERELVAKSNEMDRLSQELRRWQQEAVSSSEEKARLSALLNSALKDLRVVQESNGSTDVKSPTFSPALYKIPKALLGLPGWTSSNSGGEKLRPASQIPVSVRHSSLNEKDLFVRSQSQSARRPTSLHSCGSEDVTPHSDPGSNYASPSQDRKSVSYLPRPVKDHGPNGLPPTTTSSRKEADRLFRQSFDSSRSSQSRQSTSSPSQSGSEPVGEAVTPLQAVEPATSRATGATAF